MSISGRLSFDGCLRSTVSIKLTRDPRISRNLIRIHPERSVQLQRGPILDQNLKQIGANRYRLVLGEAPYPQAHPIGARAPYARRPDRRTTAAAHH